MACSNNYMPDYIPSDLPWYERDRRMTWYIQRKCGEFLKNSKSTLKKQKLLILTL